MKHLLILAVALSLAACGERSTGGKTPRKADAKAWQGTDNAFVASGWKPSDAAAWQEQMRLRAQTQNEYNRVR
ncbi:MAG TPA: hypothetical protein VKI18_17950 [Albitalea sp.]|nr:hypothetical protein [Albitalea sp.]